MTYKSLSFISILVLALVLNSCGNDAEKETKETEKTAGTSEKTASEKKNGKKAMKDVHLSQKKFDNLNMQIDTIPQKTFSDAVTANGHLEVPPQNEATVTAVVGANITSIIVIEGDKVEKGQVLAYLSHPNLAELQTRYIQAYHRFEYLKKELKRQKKLYDAEVGSGRKYQQTQSDFNSKKGEISGLESQLRQLNLGLSRLQNGKIYDQVPVVSPIAGYVEKVKVQIGQYADPQKDLVKIVNNDHIHADVMVYEKDVHKVKKGQKIKFTVESASNDTLEAEIYSVGKKFEQKPKAVHIHAEIKNKKGYMIPGMYIKAKISTTQKLHKAVPESAIANEGAKSYIFKAKKITENNKEKWEFKPIEVKTGPTENGFTQIELLKSIKKDTKFAMNKSYYLIAEMKKAGNSHSH
jgi:cobalt-zinc-cadmium efflux system membrane fusion protein